MIENEQQYRVTVERVRQYEDALAQAESRRAERHPLLHRTIQTGLEQTLQELREHLAEFEQRPRATALREL